MKNVVQKFLDRLQGHTKRPLAAFKVRKHFQRPRGHDLGQGQVKVTFRKGHSGQGQIFNFQTLGVAQLHFQNCIYKPYLIMLLQTAINVTWCGVVVNELDSDADVPEFESCIRQSL